MELSNKSFIDDLTCNFNQENVCINLLTQHDEECHTQSLLIGNDIDTLSDRLNKVSIIESTFVKNLEEWRNEAHEIIHKFCKSKYDEYIIRTQEEIDRLRETVSLLSNDQDAADDYIDWVKETIQSIHQQLDELQQIQHKFSPLTIEDSIITFSYPTQEVKRCPTPLKDLFSRPSSTNELNSSLSPSSSFHLMVIPPENNVSFSLKSPKLKKKFPPDHWYPLATNETHLLITGKSNLFLIDHSLTIIKKKSYLQIGIKDICWSKFLARFLIISPKEIFILDEKIMSLDSSSITLINNNPWERGTCSETILFLSTFGENPFIIEYNLSPSIHFNKRWPSSTICQESEVINDMKSNHISLALIIENGFNNESRLEIRLIKSFECIWSTCLGIGWGYRCSPFDNDHWIVIDSYKHRFIFILNNGTIDQINNYSIKPFNVVQFGDYQIAIRTTDGLDIHYYK